MKSVPRNFSSFRRGRRTIQALRLQRGLGLVECFTAPLRSAPLAPRSGHPGFRGADASSSLFKTPKWPAWRLAIGKLLQPVLKEARVCVGRSSTDTERACEANSMGDQPRLS